MLLQQTSSVLERSSLNEVLNAASERFNQPARGDSYKGLSAGNAAARAFGLAEVEETDEVFELHPKGVKAYQLFAKALSQMRFLPSGVALGLDYAAVGAKKPSHQA